MKGKNKLLGLNITLDFEDILYDYNVSESSLKDILIQSIKYEIVTYIKEDCRKQIESEIKHYIEGSFEGIVKEEFSSWLSNGTLMEGSTNVPVQEWLQNYFTKKSDYSYKNKLDDVINKRLDTWVKDLNNRYDLAFAALVVNNLAKQHLLKDDRLQELIKQE